MRNIKLTVEYDGTEFAGFQTQGKGERTIQTTLERALEELVDEPVNIAAAGRTDAGVHALGQVINFRTGSPIPIDRVAVALNGILPRDLAIRDACEVPEDFHARFYAKERTYVYLVWTAPSRSALWGRFALHEPRALDQDLMRRAASRLVGSRDFAAFANSGGEPGSTTVRDLRRLQVRSVKPGVLVAVVATANAFLRAMVRNMVGALLATGRGELSPGEMDEILASGDRTANPCATAPAHGLCLLRVNYKKDAYENV